MTKHVEEEHKRHLSLLNVNQTHRELISKSTIGIAAFTTLMVFLTVLLVSNLVAGSTDSEPWPFLGNDNAFLKGAPGASFKNILPCSKLPFASDELFGYLPITQGFLGNLIVGLKDAGTGATVEFMKEIFNPEAVASKPENIPNPENCLNTTEACQLTAECCKIDGYIVTCNDNLKCDSQELPEEAGGVLSVEPFCLAWSKTSPTSSSIDTIAFAPQFPWPPLEPLPGVVSLAPLCPIPLNQLSLEDGSIVGNCKYCQFKLGLEIGTQNVGKYRFQRTVQFDGVALSWADQGKLAYGTNSDTSDPNAPVIWDGFREQPLPEVEGINFWVRFRFNLIEKNQYDAVVTQCGTVGTFGLLKAKDLPLSLKILRIVIDVELYVAVDRQSQNGTEVGTNQNGTEVGTNFANDFTGGTDESSGRKLFQQESEGEKIWRNLQEGSTREDPCVIVTMPRAAIKLPLFGGNIVFADGLGGQCIFSPEETGTRCSPSGFFFNLRNQFRIEGGLGGILASILEDEVLGPDFPLPPLESASNSIGIFQDPDGATEAVVLRVEFPVTTLFGVPLRNVGVGRPIVHFQYVKGSEVERRRATLLRKKQRGSSGPFVANCRQVSEACKQWDDFESSDDSLDVQICSDILLNEEGAPDKLLYYNRVLTAETVNPKQEYVITPPPGQTYRTPAKYDFAGNLDADVVIVYVKVADFGNFIILVKDISAALILSDGPQVEADDADETVFVRLFCKVSVLFFVSISVGVILENYADGQNSNMYALVGQFESDTVGFRYSVAISTNIDFDRRRHLHLEGEDYRRALSNDNLKNADWSVGLSMSCAPDSACAAIGEFFEDVGEAIYEGMQAISTFFTEDVVEFFESATAAVGEWGRKFIGNVIEFGEAMVNNLANVFADGEVAQLLNGERLVAFGEKAENVISLFSDGNISINDIVVVGELAIQGLVIAADFVVAGVTDLVNAIGSFFSDIGAVFEAVGDVFNIGSSTWVEVRQKSRYTNIVDCRDDCNMAVESDQIKRHCWCMDEFECAVKIAETRKCSETCYVFVCDKDCDPWTDTPIERAGGFPRFESQAYDQSCRKERMAKIAEAKRFHGKMVESAGTVDKNTQTKFNGLSNFSPANRARRRLSWQDGVTAVNSFSVSEFAAVNAGNFGPTSFQAMYEGAQLKPDATAVDETVKGFSRNIDFSEYGHIPGQEPLLDDALIVREARRGSTDIYLEALQFDDPAWIGKQPIIPAPQLSLAENSPGTSTANPVVFECAGSISNSWMEKLQSAEPEAMRRRRSRRLQSNSMSETVVEISVLAEIRRKILAGDGVVVNVEQGDIMGEDGDQDIFANAKQLIGIDGVGSFMNPRSSRRFLRQLNGVTVRDYDLSIKTMTADPQCDRFEWTFDVRARDASGKMSEPISVHAVLFYGDTELEGEPLATIQTICDTDSTTVDDLEDNQILQFFNKVSSFSPKLRNDKCRSPFVELSSSDTVIQEGSPCTTQYKTIKREWMISTLDPLCPSSLEGTELVSQEIIAGGFVIPTTESPATPIFELQDQSYNLPNEREATVSSDVSEFYRDGEAPKSLCGICNVEGIPGIVYSHPQDFVCNEVGDNTISVTVLNRIGISVTKTANVTIIDNVPPNMATKSHTVYLNRYGWLNETDKVTVTDIDDSTWDNCGIKNMSVDPTPIYQCGDEGPQTITLTAVDVNDNMASKNETVMVDDSARLGIAGDAVLDLSKSVSKSYRDKKMKEDFGYNSCNEIAVYVRPEGKLNFEKLEYPPDLFPKFDDLDPSKDWKIPKCKDDKYGEYLRFHQALCGDFTLTAETIGEEPCMGEIKAEVACKNGSEGSSKGSSKDSNDIEEEDVVEVKRPVQTCYRAKLQAS